MHSMEIHYRGQKGTFSSPEERIREYTEKEVYATYDGFHNNDNRITPSDIAAAREIYAWPMGESEEVKNSQMKMLENVEVTKRLQKIEDRYLGDIDDGEWLIINPAIQAILSSLTNISYVGHAVATKILHLHRPNLIPILDSYVIKFLMDKDPSKLQSKTQSLWLAMDTMNIVRQSLRRNIAVLLELEMNLSDLKYPLTRTRMHDILCWTIWKWDILGETRGAAQKGGPPITRSLGCWKWPVN